MGAASSTEFSALQLSPASVCATEPRFCLPNPITLHLREKIFSFSGDDFKITCAATGTHYFRCHGRAFSMREKKVLRDSYGTPVANFKEKLFSLTEQFEIYAGEHSEKKICNCSASITFVKSRLTAYFIDAQSGQQSVVVVKGDWRAKRCVIFLGEPKQGGIPIAKIFRPFTMTTESYHLEIAAGVDIAFMTILCIAFDEHQRD